MANPDWTDPADWEDEAALSAQDAIDEFNGDPERAFDWIGGVRVYHRARRPILATDCDYEIVSVSGVQGRRLAS